MRLWGSFGGFLMKTELASKRANGNFRREKTGRG
jgi:hypothetical protein